MRWRETQGRRSIRVVSCRVVSKLFRQDQLVIEGYSVAFCCWTCTARRGGFAGLLISLGEAVFAWGIWKQIAAGSLIRLATLVETVFYRLYNSSTNTIRPIKGCCDTVSIKRKNSSIGDAQDGGKGALRKSVSSESLGTLASTVQNKISSSKTHRRFYVVLNQDAIISCCSAPL